MKIAMKNIDLNHNQSVFKDRSDLLLSKEHKFPDFRAKNIPFVSNISEKALAHLMGKTKAIRYTKKASIESEYNKANSLVVVFSGNVRVINYSHKANNGTMIQVQEPRSGFGKIALLTDELRSASTITAEKTVFAYILKNDFVSWLMNYPEVEFALMGVSTEKLVT